MWIDQDNCYKVVDFLGFYDLMLKAGYDRLKLDHIKDASQLPSTELLGEHFKMCLLRYFAGNVDLAYADGDRHAYILTDRDMSIDLSDECWSKGGGKEILEQYLSWQLFGSFLSTLDEESDSKSRWISYQLALPTQLRTPEEGQIWPDDPGRPMLYQSRRLGWQ